jgi:hypothetical protein
MKDFFGRVLDRSLRQSSPAPQPKHATMTVFPFPAQPSSEPGLLATPVTGKLRGKCPVCGLQTLFEGFTDNLRESGFCSSCGSFNRQRQIAHVIRKRYGVFAGAALSVPPGCVVYNTETTGAVHKTLSAGADYLCSEYFGEEYAPGEHVGSRQHQDLQRLSFPDESINLVLSSDVLEHVPDPYLAHSEIFRTLRRGGRHIFTVPFDGQAPLDDIRARLDEGKIVHLAEKQFHGDPVRPDQGILVWTIFGLEMLVRLARIGFQPIAWNLYEPEEGIVGPYSLVFEAIKPLSD